MNFKIFLTVVQATVLVLASYAAICVTLETQTVLLLLILKFAHFTYLETRERWN